MTPTPRPDPWGRCPECGYTARWGLFPPNFGRPYCPHCKADGIKIVPPEDRHGN